MEYKDFIHEIENTPKVREKARYFRCCKFIIKDII